MNEILTRMRMDEGGIKQPFVLSNFGSFFFGGEVVTSAGGDTFHGDHGYAQFYIPENPKSLPLVMWHGLGQSGKCWETTPDGREGFVQMFVRQQWPVYVIDQPRRGRAGRAITAGSEPGNIPSTAYESSGWKTFRIGQWNPPEPRSFNDGVQFPDDAFAVDQYFRQQTPNTGDEPFPDHDHRQFLGGAVSQLFDEVGPGILLTHSHSGQYGWVTAMKKPDLVRAVISYEPGEFAFPDDDLPPEIDSPNEVLRLFMAPQAVSRNDFLNLTKIPIAIVLGDFITDEPKAAFEPELWRMVRIRAHQFVDAINRNGGNAVLQELPKMGIFGNTHAPFSDSNNETIAKLLSEFLAENGLDGSGTPHGGPRERRRL